jgi:hypothetical protein
MADPFDSGLRLAQAGPSTRVRLRFARQRYRRSIEITRLEKRDTWP